MIQYIDLATKLPQGTSLEFQQSKHCYLSLLQLKGDLHTNRGPAPVIDPAPDGAVRSWLEKCGAKASSILLAPEMAVSPGILGDVIGGTLPLARDSLAILPLNLMTCEEAIALGEHPQCDYLASSGRIEAAQPFGKYVNALAYVYHVVGGNEPRFSLQPKTHAMGDRWPFEAENLAEGNEMLHISDGQYALLTAICSDVFNWAHGVDAGFSSLASRSLLLLHPQLCPRPLQTRFQAYRRRLFGTTAFQRCQVITLNWGEGTRLNDQPFFKNGNHPTSGFWTKDVTPQASPAKFDSNFRNGLYHHINIEDRVHVFTLNPASHVWSMQIRRRDPAIPETASAAYPIVSTPRAIETGEPLSLKPDVFDFLQDRKIDLGDVVGAFPPLAREGFLSAAGSRHVVKDIIVSDPDSLPHCNSTSDETSVVQFFPTSDTTSNASRTAVHHNVATLLGILSTPNRWPEVLRRFAAATPISDYRGGIPTSRFTMSAEQDTKVAAVFIGMATDFDAERVRDDLLDTSRTQGDPMVCVWYFGGDTIRFSFNPPDTNIASVPAPSERSILKRYRDEQHN